MVSLSQAINGVLGGSEELHFLTEVLKQYREVRKVYHYEYREEDKAALQACATDLRPFSYSFLPGGALYWVMGKMAPSTKQLGMVSRAALVLLRLGAAAEVFRLGYLVGSYKQGMDCTQRLVSLRTPLGGEIAAIIRARDPDHPLLRHERQPAELHEDGSRPRIVSEANRLAKIEHLRGELAAAKAGRVVDRANDRAEERLMHIFHQREELLEEIQRGEGPTAAASAGDLAAMQPATTRSYREEYGGAGTAGIAGAAGVSAVAGGGSIASVTRSGGLVISDQSGPSLQAAAAEQLAALQAAGSARSRTHAGTAADGVSPTTGTGGSSGTGNSSSGDSLDPFAILLGAAGSDSWDAAGESAEARQKAADDEAQRRRRERRRNWWWRHSGRVDES